MIPRGSARLKKKTRGWVDGDNEPNHFSIFLSRASTQTSSARGFNKENINRKREREHLVSDGHCVTRVSSVFCILSCLLLIRPTKVSRSRDRFYPFFKEKVPCLHTAITNSGKEEVTALRLEIFCKHTIESVGHKISFSPDKTVIQVVAWSLITSNMLNKTQLSYIAV